MYYKFLICLALAVLLGSPAWAQENAIESALDYKINKMTKELDLTRAQAISVRPIIKSYLIKKTAMLQEGTGQGIMDHVAVKSSFQSLQDQENTELGKVLTPEQMKKWVNKEKLMAILNPDSAQSLDDDGPSLTPEGADFKF